MDTAENFIKNVNTLVPRPDIALEVISLAHEQECDIDKLAEIIQQDPSLTANMLHLANSAYFGHMQKIDSLTKIIVRLGLETIKMFAITGASVAFLRSPQDAYNMVPGRLWKHSYATALLASIIGNRAGHDNISGTYSAALLHDVGKIVLNKPLLAEAHNRQEFWQAGNITVYENNMLGTDHAKTGQSLLVKWGLPKSITDPIAIHHNSKAITTADLSSKIVYISNILTENFGIKAADTEEDFFSIDPESQEIDFLEIPNLESNLDQIIEEFFEKFNNSSI